MVLFKKKINIDGFLAMLLVYGFKLFEREFDFLIAVVDEKKILSKDDKDKLKELSGALVVVNLIVGKDIHFNDKISHDEFSERIGKIYINFLEDVKTLNRQEIDTRADQVAELIKTWKTLSEKRINNNPWEPEKYSLYSIDSVNDMEKFTLCYAFADLYSNKKEKNIAAFKFAKYFVKNDMTGEYLKEFKLIFN